MSNITRREQILSILEQRIFITVQELSRLTYTSTSSIRRDLTFLENSGMVKRSHGGVSLPQPIVGVAGFYDRSHMNTKKKRIIAQKAATLLKPGQKILLDSSSTAEMLLPHIAKVKDVSVFTNTLPTAIHAIELGIDTHCLGGHCQKGSVALSGGGTIRALSNLNVDILFFSSQSLDDKGHISDSTEEENLVRVFMLKAAKTTVFLCDSAKFDTRTTYGLCNLDEVDYAVFDAPYEALETKCRIL